MLELYGHPFSSYTWKALIALYETDTPFEFRMLDADHPDNGAAFATHWPVGKFPLLVDDGVPIMESSIIVEHVAPDLIPADRNAAREARMLDRVFDNHVMNMMQQVVFDALRPEGERGTARVRAVCATALDTVYSWLDARLAGRTWAAGDDFTLADCAGAPSLFYADWVHPIPDPCPTLRAYRARVLARPSVARCVDEARPYRPFFPLGAPDRD
ncbi:MAG: glutathione S-transferase family protein [Gammaproteobacteria bacterium]|nr:glutathione S-transferase family protein [Gammaproteobacteria bacterium]